eukprot:3621841-Rhodomonas_salina.3
MSPTPSSPCSPASPHLSISLNININNLLSATTTWILLPSFLTCFHHTTRPVPQAPPLPPHTRPLSTTQRTQKKGKHRVSPPKSVSVWGLTIADEGRPLAFECPGRHRWDVRIAQDIDIRVIESRKT